MIFIKWFIRFFIICGLIFFGGMSLLVLYAEFGLPWKYGHKQQVMETYLEEKYKDRFTFEKVRFDLMHGQQYYSYATAASTGVTFYVEVSPENTVEDGYSYEYWQGEIQALFEPLLKPTLLQYERVNGEVFLTKEMNLQTFEQDAVTFTLRVAMGSFLKEESINEQATRWFAAIEAIRAAGLSVEQIAIVYYDKEIPLQRDELLKIQSAAQLHDFLKVQTSYK